LKRRKPFTVERWVHRFQAEGSTGLHIRPGRGRKPAFSPCGVHGAGGEDGLGAVGPA
jgi:hypothetical protein